MNLEKKVFRDVNGYPNWTIEQNIEKMKNQNKMARPTQVTINTEENKRLLMLLYKGRAAETRLKSLQNALNSVIPPNNTFKIIYTGTKLPSKFNLKDEINEKQKYDLIYKAQFPDFNCDVTYKVEGKKRLSERIIDHSRCDDKSQDICMRTCKNDRT